MIPTRVLFQNKTIDQVSAGTGHSLALAVPKWTSGRHPLDLLHEYYTAKYCPFQLAGSYSQASLDMVYYDAQMVNEDELQAHATACLSHEEHA